MPRIHIHLNYQHSARQNISDHAALNAFREGENVFSLVVLPGSAFGNLQHPSALHVNMQSIHSSFSSRHLRRRARSLDLLSIVDSITEVQGYASLSRHSRQRSPTRRDDLNQSDIHQENTSKPHCPCNHNFAPITYRVFLACAHGPSLYSKLRDALKQ